MKKFLYYILFLNIIPYVCVILFNTNNEYNNEIVPVNEIKLLKVAENVVVNIELEEYIKGVTYAEMPASFEIEALKAQAVAARTYTYRKIGQRTHESGDICDNPAHCQAFREKDENSNYEKVSNAVDATKGEIITYNGNIINALFHASSGGKTENVEDVWNSNKIEYLSSVESPGEEALMKDFITEVVFYKNDFANKLETFDKNFKYNGEIEAINRNSSGRVKSIKIGNKEFSGTEIRSIFGLRSSNFEIQIEDDEIRFVVKGYGHGVGLSQWGAQAMAINKANYKDILLHYYLGTQIQLIKA